MAQLLEMNPGVYELEALLEGRFEFAEPRIVLGGLSGEGALRPVPGLPYTIASLLGHMQWWQERRIDVALGDVEMASDYEPGKTDWPEVGVEGWPVLVEDFLSGLDRMRDLASDPERLKRIVFGERSVGFIFTSHSVHNAYHLGQIVLMRRLLGLWPEIKHED